MSQAVKGSGFEFKINARAIRRLFNDMPRVLNAQMNRTFPKSSTDFLKHFASRRLVKGVFWVKRKLKKKKGRKATGQPSIPAKARAAGFTARVSGRQSLERKEFRVRTSNPLLTIREKGGPIRPQKGEWLYIHADFKGRGAAKRRKAFSERQRSSGSRYSKPIVARVRQINVPAILGFYSSWRSWRPTFREFLHEGLRAAVKRMAGKAASRRAG